MQFELFNTGRSNRIVPGVRGQVVIPPQHTVNGTNKRADLTDTIAINIRRFEQKGGDLKIKAVNPEGEAILERAGLAPTRKDKHFNMIGNPPVDTPVDTVLKELVEPDVIKDELAEDPLPAPGISRETIEAALLATGGPSAELAAHSPAEVEQALADVGGSPDPTPPRKRRPAQPAASSAASGRRRLKA